MLSVPQRDLVTSLASCTCPACGKRKKERQTFCGDCYYFLPIAMRQALYRRIGQGYEIAIGAALERLGVNSFRMPAAPKPAAKQGELFGHAPREGMGR